MKDPRRILSLFFAALVVLSASVFLYQGKAYADSLDPQVISPLRQQEPVLEQANQIVVQKQDALDGENNQVIQLLQKKDQLSQQLQDIQSQVQQLKDQIAQKKAAAEAEQKRLDAIKNMFVHVTRYSAGSEGNLYAPGNCTWYVKSRRPDLPNNLGNANTWYVNAAADGYNVGLTPKKGAVGTTTRGALGHVVYVEAVSLDGLTVTISEMNARGLGVIDTRTEAASDFQYIYELN